MALVVNDSSILMIDKAYEYLAPQFFDFIEGETKDQSRRAELWFDAAPTYAPSPCMPNIKTGRIVQLESLCDFSEAEQERKGLESTEFTTMSGSMTSLNSTSVTEKKLIVETGDTSLSMNVEPMLGEATSSAKVVTPRSRIHSQKGNNTLQTGCKNQKTANKIANMVTPSALKSTDQSKQSQAKCVKPENRRRNTSLMNKVRIPNWAHENQPIKKLKLDGDKTKQIYAREPAVEPFVSMAEMMNKFQSNTREMSISCARSCLSHDAVGSEIWRTPKLTLTRPKEPELETSQRTRSVRFKSSAELEEEMMAKILTFKARPVNRKILDASTLPTLPRSTPQRPKFQEFHLETFARANHNIETSTTTSPEAAPHDQQWKPHFPAPKMPTLQTSLRARPPRIKSFQELEQEELEKFLKFKARPLNRKILESKGELGVFCNKKRQHTVPQEFHFAVDERIPPPSTVCDLFNKLSLKSVSQKNKCPRNTSLNPFHLRTEERGLKKETEFSMEVMQKQLEEERARVPKANPYPYTTDFLVLPPKPWPKPCTKPESFQLESLVRHEEEMQREMETRQRIEREEAQMRFFKAQPILKEDPIPLPVKVRKSLTEVKEFDLHVEHRAVDRAYFDKMFISNFALTVDSVSVAWPKPDEYPPEANKVSSKSSISGKEPNVNLPEQPRPKSEGSVQSHETHTNSSKAFTGSIVEHTHNVDSNSTNQPAASASKPVSRFKMQRRQQWYFLIHTCLVAEADKSESVTSEKKIKLDSDMAKRPICGFTSN